MSQNQFIPQNRQQIIELCLAEEQLSAEDAARFRAFCYLLSAYTHHEFHQNEEALKLNYLPFNPDAGTNIRPTLIPDERGRMEAKLLDLLSETLQRANYRSLDWVAIQQAIQLADLVEIKTEIDFQDFEQLLFYYRGESSAKGERPRFLWTQRINMQVYSNVILALKFKDEAHFTKKGIKLDQLTFRPGCIYFYLYKDIPQNDLELLFPNVQLSMNQFDRMLFVVPALGAGISMLVKIVPNLLLLAGVIAFLTFGPSFSERLGVTENQIRDLSPIMFAFTSVMLALGGFAYKQYDSYKNKRIRFMKNVTETLFFRNLANNSSVFHYVIDAAEEEQCKEAILLYYHLLINNRSLTKEHLLQEIESWLFKHTQHAVQFNMDKALSRLANLSAEISSPGESRPHKVALLSLADDGICRIPSLTEAKLIIDTLWDSAYNAAK